MTDARTIRVKLSHGKARHKVEVVRGEPFEDFQARVFSLTQVPPERQKFILKGKQINNEEDMARIKKKSTILLQGSADARIEHVPESERTRFIEDMTDAERQEVMAVLPPGLENLGNTCYLNSTLQCVKAIPEVRDALKQKGMVGSGPAPAGMMALQPFSPELGRMFMNMEMTSDSFVPHEFVTYFRQRFPRFATRDERTRAFQQQDAGEVFTEMLSLMRAELTTDSGNVIDHLMQGTIREELKLEETGESQVSDQAFDRLQCFITQETRGIVDGVLKGFEGELEKRSDALGANAVWTKRFRVIDLPQYLHVQLMRFEYRTDVKKATKITRRVIFPDRMDIYPLVSDEMKSIIGQYRRQKLFYEDKQREKRQAGLIDAMEVDDAKAQNAAVSANEPSPMNVDEPDEKETAALQREVALTRENACTGYYQLFAMVAHKGQSANSGHYIGYAKDEKRGWLKFDDAFVSEVPEEKIKDLYGGLAQWQMGYLCFYKREEPDLKIFDVDDVSSDVPAESATE